MSESPKKIKSESKMLKLQEDEYQLEMSLYDDNCIEFKVALNSPMSTCHYLEKYDLETIKEISFLYHKKYNNIEAIYQYYKEKILARKEMNLVLSQDKNVMSLMYKKIVDEETIDVELKLKKKILKKDDIVQALMKEVEQLKKTVIEQEKKNEELKKCIDLLMEENKKIKEKKKEEKRKNEVEKNEENWKIEEEKFSSMNDNVNLINNFKFENFPELKYIESISCGKRCNYKTVAVYCIIKNEERLYQMAYCKNKYYSQDEYPTDIIIYNLKLNKIENKIYNAHGSYKIDSLKHYYNSSAKNHILLSSTLSNGYDYHCKLWNISSNPIINILKVKDCFKLCLMFNNEDFFIFGNKYEQTNNDYYDTRMCVWNKNGAFIKKMNKSNLNYGLEFIEATYFENKNYILLSGQHYDQNKGEHKYCSECYNYDEDDIKIYIDDENNSCAYCINLFKKGNSIYFITGYREKVNIFEFESTKLIKRIQLGEKDVYSLCSINEKYIIASNSSKLKIIDMEKYSVVKDYSAYGDDGEDCEIYGIEKIKIPEKGEFIITYSDKGIIRIWKM